MRLGLGLGLEQRSTAIKSRDKKPKLAEIETMTLDIKVKSLDHTKRAQFNNSHVKFRDGGVLSITYADFSVRYFATLRE